MKASTREAAGFSSQSLESGQCTPGKPTISMSFRRHLTKLQSQGTGVGLAAFGRLDLFNCLLE